MGNQSCSILPSKGKKLFKTLDTQFGRQKAIDLYFIAANKDFQNDYKDSLILDDEGIPTFSSFIQSPLISRMVGKNAVINAFQKKFGKYKDTPEDYAKAVNAAFAFNKQEPKYTAVVTKEKEGYTVKVYPRDARNILQSSNDYLKTKYNQLIGQQFNHTFPHDLDIHSAIDSLVGDNKTSNPEFFRQAIKIFREEPLIQRLLNMVRDSDSEVTISTIAKILDDVNQGKTSKEYAPEEVLADRALIFMRRKFMQAQDAIQDSLADIKSELDPLGYSMDQGISEQTKEAVQKQRAVNRNVKTLTKALEVELKRYKIMKASNSADANKGDKLAEQEVLIEQLKYALSEDGDAALGLLQYAKHALDNLVSINKEMDNLNAADSHTFRVLRAAKNYVESYATLTNFFNEIIDDTSNPLISEPMMIGDQEISVKEIIGSLNNLSKTLVGRYNELTINKFAKLLSSALGDKFMERLSERVTKEEFIKQQLQSIEGDITFTDRWIDSLGDTSDITTQLIDRILKDVEGKIRNRTIDLQKRLATLRKEAEANGITNFDWLYEKFSDGKLTGYYISKYNEGKFRKDIQDKKDQLQKKYGKRRTASQEERYQKELEEYLDTISTKGVGGVRIPHKEYINNDFIGLSPKKQEYYKKIMSIKELDKLFGDDANEDINAIQKRRTSSERLINTASSPTQLITNIKEEIGNALLEKEDDADEFGVTRAGITDFSGQEYRLLPKLYIRKLENPNEISTDIFSTLLMYGHSAYNYQGMSEITDAMEVGRDIYKRRVPKQKRGSLPVVEKVKVLGHEVTNPVAGETNKLFEKLNDILDARVYGRYLKDSGIVEIFGKKVNKNKLTSVALGMSNAAYLSLNWLNDTANILNGVAMQNVEAAAAQYFSPKELLEADGYYGKHLTELLGELGARDKTSTLHLLGELFNISQDYEQSIGKPMKKNVVYRVFGARIGTLFQEGGNHWLYYRSAIAQLKHIKVKDSHGNKISLLDALEVVEVGKSKKMVIKEGITNLDGTKIDTILIGDQIAHINQSLFGIYNQQDRNAANRVIAGRLMMNLRNWMKPLFNRRFMAEQHSVVMNESEEGFYRTVGRVALGIGRELIRGKGQVGATWGNLKSWEKKNLARALADFVQFLAIWALADGIEWPDDKERPQYLKFAEYSCKRLRRELGAVVPSTIMAEEIKNTVESPIAMMGNITNVFRLFNSLISPEDWVTEVESGQYKGQTVLQKNIMRAPIPVLSWYRQIDKFTGNIEASIDWYARGSR